jgi:plastocyanin
VSRLSVLLASWLTCALTLGVVSAASAASLTVHSFDADGKPMPDVAIALYPKFSIPFDRAIPPDAVVAQQNMQFVPYLTVIRTGSRVSFPNRDNMEHHLKSFSATKEFEFKIYSSGTPPPVVFDRPGPVGLHCLIHDWMQGFIYVVDTPFYGATDAGGATSLDSLPEGKYEVRAWHPTMSSYLPPLSKDVTLGNGGQTEVRFDFAFVPKKRRQPHPLS